MRALIVDDEPKRDAVASIRKILEACGYTVENENLTQGEGIFFESFCEDVNKMERAPAIAVIDYNLKWKSIDSNATYNGGEVANFFRQRWKDDLPFYILFISAALQSLDLRYETLVKLLRTPYAGFIETRGADWEADAELHIRVASDLARSAKRRTIGALSPSTKQVILNASSAGKKIISSSQIDEAARHGIHDEPVLITGESGTGKTVAARVIHDNSNRRNAEFVEVNMGGISPNLVAVELFGSVKGVATDVGDNIGHFDKAEGGTIFLDEIGDANAEVQQNLLTVLESKQFLRVGGRKPIKTNVRVIAATNKDLLAEASEKRFREELYYRLNRFPFRMKPVRERGLEGVDFAEYVMAESAIKFQKSAETRLSEHAKKWISIQVWKGNLREIENVISRAVFYAGSEIIDVSDLEAAKGLDAPSADVEWTSFQQEWNDYDINVKSEYVDFWIGKGGSILGAARALSDFAVTKEMTDKQIEDAVENLRQKIVDNRKIRDVDIALGLKRKKNIDVGPIRPEMRKQRNKK